MSVPEHHKEIAKHIREKVGEPARVNVYRDDQGNRPVPIGTFGPGKSHFFSTIGLCDTSFDIPSGRYEFAAIGSSSWLPNALASSVYWLKDRSIEDWPLVCEDVIKKNARSSFRHMAYLPSEYEYPLLPGIKLRWMMGVPIKDSEISMDHDEIAQKISEIYRNTFLMLK